MRLAFAIFKYFPHGGLQCDMMRLAQEAARRKHQVSIYTSNWQGEMPLDENISVNLITQQRRSNHARAIEFEAKFHALTQERQYDALVAFNRIGGCDFYFAADNCLAEELPKTRPAWQLRLLPRYRSYLKQEKSIFVPNLNTRILHITEQQKQDFQHHYNTETERLFLLPPGMNPACKRGQDAEMRRELQRRQLGLSAEQIMLIQIGALTLGKGVDRNLEALAQLPLPLRKQVQFYFVGAGKPGKFQKLARKLDVAKQVHFPGARSDVPDLLLAADLMSHPARNEAAGSVLIESLAAGTPVLCSAECGFSNYPMEATGLHLSRPYQAAEYQKNLLLALQNLPELKAKTRTYAENADFYSRAAKAIDIIEKYS